MSRARGWRDGLEARAARVFHRCAGGVDALAARALIRPSLLRAAARAEARVLADASSSGEEPRRLDPEGFLAPTLPTPELQRVATAGLADEVWDARWTDPSTRIACPRDMAAARLFLHRVPASSAVLLVHGYLGGDYRVERWLWPLRRLFRRGHDVALVTLPGHGVRAPRDGAHAYPSRDVHATARTTRQAIRELRGLLKFFRARRSVVGAAGVSLGGFLVALLATVEAELSFAIPVVPLSDLTAFAMGHVPDTASRAQMERTLPAAALADLSTSPLTRPSLLPRGRVVVLGALGDRIAPPSHAMELARHFGGALELFPGGHLLQASHGRLLRAIDRLTDGSVAHAPRASRRAPRHGPRDAHPMPTLGGPQDA